MNEPQKNIKNENLVEIKTNVKFKSSPIVKENTGNQSNHSSIPENSEELEKSINLLFKEILSNFEKSYAKYTSEKKDGKEDKLINFTGTDGKIEPNKLEQIAKILKSAANSEDFEKNLKGEEGILNINGNDVNEKFESTNYGK